MIPKNYDDPTANIAIGNVDRERKQAFKRLITTLHYIAGLAGYKITKLKVERKVNHD